MPYLNKRLGVCIKFSTLCSTANIELFCVKQSEKSTFELMPYRAYRILDISYSAKD
jgi:hypothetical protein